MPEHNTLNTVIHAALRRDLARFEAALGSFPTGSRQRADQLALAWGNFSQQLHDHHSDEEAIFWPALRALGADESTMSELEGEHRGMLAALDSTDTTMKAFRTAPDRDAAASAWSSVTALGAVVGGHLDHEEADLEPLAAAHRGSPPMRAASRAVRQAHKGNAGVFFAWLLDGADPEARAGLHREVPAPVVFVLSRFGGRTYGRTVAPVWA